MKTEIIAKNVVPVIFPIVGECFCISDLKDEIFIRIDDVIGAGMFKDKEETGESGIIFALSLNFNSFHFFVLDDVTIIPMRPVGGVMRFEECP